MLYVLQWNPLSNLLLNCWSSLMWNTYLVRCSPKTLWSGTLLANATKEGVMTIPLFTKYPWMLSHFFNSRQYTKTSKLWTLKLLVLTIHLFKFHNPFASVPEESRLFNNNIGVCMYDNMCMCMTVFKSVYLGSSVFLVPFLNFASKFIVKSLAKEWPRMFIHRSTTALSSSILYCSYFGGILWLMVSQCWRTESQLRVVSNISAFTLVSGVFCFTAVVLRDWRTTTSIDSIKWNTCRQKNQ